MTQFKRVEDMPVYQQFYKLALRVERETRDYPGEFRWLRGQSLRASESVCANMSEGFFAQYSTEYTHSLYRCRREGREMMTHVQYAKDVGVLDGETAKVLLADYEDALRDLNKLIGSIQSKTKLRGKGKPSSKIQEEPGPYVVDE